MNLSKSLLISGPHKMKGLGSLAYPLPLPRPGHFKNVNWCYHMGSDSICTLFGEKLGCEREK